MKTRKRRRHDEPAQAPSPAADAPDAEAQESAQENAEARRKREQWERDQAKSLRERDETRRELFTIFRIWTICPHKNCRRAQACRAVDTEECRRERWRHVITEEMRFMLSRMSQLACEGYPARDTVRLARAEWEAKEKAWATIEARQGAQRPADVGAPDRPAADSVPDDRGPRIRCL